MKIIYKKINQVKLINYVMELFVVTSSMVKKGATFDAKSTSTNFLKKLKKISFYSILQIQNFQ